MDGFSRQFCNRSTSSLARVVIFGFGVLLGVSHSCLAADHHVEYVRLQQAYAQELTDLAAEYEAQGQITEAREVRELGLPYTHRDPSAEVISHLPRTGTEELPADQRGRLQELWRLREEYAQNLYILANLARRDGQISLAFDLVHEVLFQDPEHARTRRLLGYQIYEGAWTTPFEAQKRGDGYVWHDTFGWIRGTDVDRYESGLRPYRGNWIPAEQESGIRGNFNNAWVIESEHFLIRTNHSLERGVQLSVMLEDYYQFFVAKFAAAFQTTQQIESLFQGSNSNSVSARQHEVHYFATREEFVQTLIRRQPGVENSTGLYMPSDRIAYFFHDESQIDRNNETLYHEATHQILGESATNIQNVGAMSHFWVVEGLACYMESFRGDEGLLEVGDITHPRMHWARERIVTDNYYIPLAEFELLGTADFQRGDITTLQRRYSQATGLSHFFLHYADGVYRDAFIEYVSQLYSPNARIRTRVESLSALTGISNEELDEQYQDYIRALRASDRN